MDNTIKQTKAIDSDQIEISIRADYINTAQKLLERDITIEERNKLELAIKWLKNLKSSADQVVTSTSLIKILEHKYNLNGVRNKKIHW